MMEDPNKTINEVVDSIKSEGLFDHFRKECLEEFEKMETYHQLKQRVENHVAAFLSKHKYHDGLQKNTLRNNLRNHISKSEVLLNSIQQLVDEVLSLKGHSFCLRIDKQVDKYLNKDSNAKSASTDSGIHSDNAPEISDDKKSEKTERNSQERVDCTAEETKVEECSESTIVTELTEIEEVEMEINENQESSEVSGNEDNKEMICEENQSNEQSESEEYKSNKNIGEANEEERQNKTDIASNSENNLDTSDRITEIVSEGAEEKSQEEKIINDNQEGIYDNHEGKNDNDAEDRTWSHITEQNDKIKSDYDDDKVEASEWQLGAEVEHEKQVAGEGNESGKSKVNEERNENSINEEEEEYKKVETIKLSSFITEPISDDSASNQSSFTEDVKNENSDVIEDTETTPEYNEAKTRRKSSRVRTLPLKYRECDDASKKRNEDTDSVSSNDVDVKDIEDASVRSKRTKRGQEQLTDYISSISMIANEGHASRLRRSTTEYQTGNEKKRKRSTSLSLSTADDTDSTTSRTRRNKKLEEEKEEISKKGEKLSTSTVPCDENPNKRTRRSIRQRQCYSP